MCLFTHNYEFVKLSELRHGWRHHPMPIVADSAHASNSWICFFMLIICGFWYWCHSVVLPPDSECNSPECAHAVTCMAIGDNMTKAVSVYCNFNNFKVAAQFSKKHARITLLVLLFLRLSWEKLAPVWLEHAMGILILSLRSKIEQEPPIAMLTYLQFCSSSSLSFYH